MSQARRMGVMKGTLASEGAKIKDVVRSTWSSDVKATQKNFEIPKKGMSQEAIIQMMRKWSQLDRRSWDGTKVYVSGNNQMSTAVFLVVVVMWLSKQPLSRIQNISTPVITRTLL